MVGVVLPDAYLDPLCTQCMMQTQDSGRQHAQLSHKWPEPSGEFDEDERLPVPNCPLLSSLGTELEAERLPTAITTDCCRRELSFSSLTRCSASQSKPTSRASWSWLAG
jgi:hypothetical protein